MYGLVAMVSYLPGGPLADRFSARSLVTVALLVTAAGGLYYATAPGLAALKLLYAFWGMSTVLLYWAALIRATRLWGGQDSQGRAFGILDGGRGLLAALLATVTVAVFAALLRLRRCCACPVAPFPCLRRAAASQPPAGLGSLRSRGDL